MKASEATLETVETTALLNELRRRSSVFFCCMRPLSDHDYNWGRYWGINGVEGANGDREGIARVLGLIELAKFDMIYVPPTLDDIV